jgi:hypothetical protein
VGSPPFRRALAIAVSLAGLVAGCGSDGDDEQIRETVGRFTDAVADRDVGEVCSLMGERLKAVFQDDCETATIFVDEERTYTTISDIVVNEDEALVSFEDSDSVIQLERSDGGWIVKDV